MAKVNFFFPGTSVAPQNERDVDSRDSSFIVSIMPQYAHSYCFSDDKTRYWVGKEYSNEDFSIKYPHLKNEEDLVNAKRIVKARTGGFYPLAETDVVISV